MSLGEILLTERQRGGGGGRRTAWLVELVIVPWLSERASHLLVFVIGCLCSAHPCVMHVENTMIDQSGACIYIIQELTIISTDCRWTL